MATPQQIQASLIGYPRTLVWNDFTPVNSSPSPPFAAQTSSSYSWRHGPAALQSDGYYRLTNVRVTVTFNAASSWRDTSWFATASTADQARLLEHEQGHFEITGLIARDLCAGLLDLSMNDTIVGVLRGVGDSAAARLNYARQKLNEEAQKLVSAATSLQQWLENATIGGVLREGQYERDTNHGDNGVAQQRWTDLFRNARISSTPLSLLMAMYGCSAGMNVCVTNTP